MSETLILGTQLTSEHKKRMVKHQRVYRRVGATFLLALRQYSNLSICLRTHALETPSPQTLGAALTR